MKTFFTIPNIILFVALIILASCSKKESRVTKMEYKDTSVSITRISQKYSNGYVKLEFDNGLTGTCKIPGNILNDIQKNINGYKLQFKIIPDSVIAEKEDYFQYIINVRTNEKIPFNNKYSIKDEDYNEILNVVLRDESARRECFGKVKDKRKILDIDLFDLNSDGTEEFIVWCTNTECFIYNHGMDVYVLEKRDSKFITLYQDVTEALDIQNEITNGYFNLEGSGLAGRGQSNPDEVITSYIFDGNKYIEGGTYFRKVFPGEDEWEEDYGD